MTDDNSAGCARLLEERNRLKLTQETISKKCGISTKTVGRWEASTPIPSDQLGKLWSLDFDVFYILTGKTIESCYQFSVVAKRI